jgi:hypothetical protein
MSTGLTNLNYRPDLLQATLAFTGWSGFINGKHPVSYAHSFKYEKFVGRVSIPDIMARTMPTPCRARRVIKPLLRVFDLYVRFLRTASGAQSPIASLWVPVSIP